MSIAHTKAYAYTYTQVGLQLHDAKKVMIKQSKLIGVQMPTAKIILSIFAHEK